MSDIIRLMTYTMTIRPRRQVTLDAELLAAVGASEGERLIAEVKGKEIVLRLGREVAWDAFKELQKAMMKSGIPESEFQNEIKRGRKELAKQIKWYD